MTITLKYTCEPNDVIIPAFLPWSVTEGGTEDGEPIEQRVMCFCVSRWQAEQIAKAMNAQQPPVAVRGTDGA